MSWNGLVWSILHRELLEQSRQRAGAWLRSGGAAILMLALLIGWSLPVMKGQTDGRGLFTGLNHVVIAVIWLVAPVLTADCISRERREGTLGLLFLTPLRPMDVVIGKAFAHALRAFTVVLVSTPVLVVPMMMGGVNGWDVGRMLLLHLSILGLSLAAGLLASSLAENWVRARLLGLVLAVAAGVGFAGIYSAFTSVYHWRLIQRFEPNIGLAEVWMGQMWGWAYRLGVGPNGTASISGSFWDPVAGSGSGPDSLALAAKVLAVSAVAVVGAVWVATFSVRRAWSSAGGGKLRLLGAGLTRVRIPTGWWRWLRRRGLDRNPIGWRQTATWSGRLTGWGWFAFAIVWLSRGVERAGQGIGLESILLAGLGAAAGASFRSEREEGTLELLLVTPTTPARIIVGRAIGLVRQFVPAIGLAVLFLGFGPLATPQDRLDLFRWLMLLPGVAAFGQFLSTRPLSTVTTLLLSVAVPIAAWLGVETLFWRVDRLLVNEVPFDIDKTVWQWVLVSVSALVSVLWAVFWTKGAIRNLAQRRFLPGQLRLERAPTSPHRPTRS